MTKTSISDKKQNLIGFCFEEECLRALQRVAHPISDGEDQVIIDLKRASGLTYGRMVLYNVI